MPAPNGTNRIAASPTKEFFIYMLIRDIGLMRAIVDLVDNSVDGAVAARSNGNLSGFWVRLEANNDRFRITDNCGGIPVDIARSYAFRFGRPRDFAQARHSIGQFGVGMKRALFKLGEEFSIRSTSRESRFSMHVDVREWLQDEDTWEFQFSEIEQEAFPQEEAGTEIEVTKLHQAVGEQFSLENFLNNLGREISAAHNESIQKGLGISLNGVPLAIRPLEMLRSEELAPAFFQRVIETTGHPKIDVRIYAGVADSKYNEAGWYVSCNGRLVLEADQTITTGWGHGSDSTIPRFHPQFARFRGFVFFDSDATDLLPWNTTKTGIDEDSRIYQAVRLDMIRLMRPVIDFLNALATPNEESQAREAVENASPVRLDDISQNQNFLFPAETVVAAQRPREAHISYAKPLDQFEAVRERLGVRSRREVGEKTFDYYYDAEVRQ